MTDTRDSASAATRHAGAERFILPLVKHGDTWAGTPTNAQFVEGDIVRMFCPDHVNEREVCVAKLAIDGKVVVERASLAGLDLAIRGRRLTVRNGQRVSCMLNVDGDVPVALVVANCTLRAASRQARRSARTGSK